MVQFQNLWINKPRTQGFAGMLRKMARRPPETPRALFLLRTPANPICVLCAYFLYSCKTITKSTHSEGEPNLF